MNTIADVRQTAQRLFEYCRSNNWSGYDPYDALNSPLFEAIPMLNRRIPRLVFTQALKRSPINVRPLLRVPKTQNPKGMALFLAALLKSPELADEETIQSLRDRLLELRSPRIPYWCWGYSFPWQTRSLLVPRHAPNLVCSVFAGNALLDLHDRSPREDYVAITANTADYILNAIYWTEGEDVAGLGYPLPSMRHQIHNANLLGAAFLSRVYRLTGERKYADAALKLARYSASRQRSDGSWMYGETEAYQWVDNFHTGYNLCALQQVGRLLETGEFESRIRVGFDFYRQHFFREDGAARYFHDKTYPIDIHCIAQSIITLVAFRSLGEDNVALSLKVFGWAKDHMWNDQGFFAYRALRGCKIRTPYMRWSEAWMLLALCTLMSETRESGSAIRTGVERSPAAAGGVQK
jgi:hypothetical protein